mgnify:FL=1
MKRKLLVAGLASICVACSAAGIAACAPDAPEAQEGTIYQTGVETFWVGVGKAYMTFEYAEEPETPEEGAIYGYVFNVNVDAGDGYSSWLTGSWELSEDESTLTLTATWQEGDNSTYLADATSGQAKTYTAADGEFTIGVNLPSAGTVNFTLNPETDKVGEEQTPGEPEEPECAEHVDADGDGKCDNCGEDMPAETPEVAMTLTASTAAGQSAKIELMSDNAWALSISYYSGGAYTPTASGTYALDAAYNMVLTVTEDTAEVLPEESYTFACDYATQTYSGTIEVKNVPVVGDLTLNFTTGEATDPDPEPEPEPEPEPGEALYTSNVASIYSGQGSAYLALEEGGVFNVYVTFGGSTSSWLNGTWTMENEVLTVTPSGGEAVNCPLTDKAYTVALSLPGAEVDFVIDMDENSVTYTVNYMLNDGTSTVYNTAEIKGNPQEAYITAAPAAPAREGYHFAGWQTKAEITEDDIVNGVSRYMWFFGQKLSTTGIAKYNAMTEEQKEEHAISDGYMLISDSADDNNTLTLYARWVKEKEIATPQQLQDIGKDLYGAYKLTADITLTGEWEPIGAYFSNYEYYNTEWWTYSFRGTLNGNGHTVSGLKITSAELNKNYSGAGSVWFDDGVTCDGTAAMFSALAGANISGLTIKDAVIDVTYSGDYLYAGALAAFDMKSTLTDINVTDCNIKATFDETELTYRTNLFTVVGGLEAGGWTNVVTGCEVSGSITLNATNKVAHGGEIYLGGMLGENYSTMTGCKTDVALTLNYEDKGTAAEDSCITANVGGLSGSGTAISGCTVNADITVKAVKDNGESSVNVGGIVGSQRYMVTENNTVTAEIVTTGTSLDEEAGVLNVGGVGGRIDVYYTLQILAYTPIVEAGARNNTQNVTVNGVVTDVIIADAVSVIPGCWYIAKGDQLDYGATSNIDAVIEAYGSYLPIDSLQDGIIFIVNTPPQAE